MSLPATGRVATKTGGIPPIRQRLAQARWVIPVPGRMAPFQHLPSQISPVMRQRPSGATVGGTGSPAPSTGTRPGGSTCIWSWVPRLSMAPVASTSRPSSAGSASTPVLPRPESRMARPAGCAASGGRWSVG
jgi:hypothetical protein